MPFEDRDLQQLGQRGILLEEAERQLDLLRHPPQAIRLDRPCRAGDGIVVVPDERHDDLLEGFDEAARTGRMQKFVPASGAASRMFRDLTAPLASPRSLERRELQTAAAQDDSEAQRLLEFFENLERFAFHKALAAAVDERGLDFDGCLRQGHYRPLLEVLLGSSAMDYAGLPKGLIPFHSYPEGTRAPLEEHLVEAAGYTRDGEGRCRLHFTVPQLHRELFEGEAAAACRRLESSLGARFEISFSVQGPSTDTLALDAVGQPFRQDDGSLLLRPAGHGALLTNLGALGGDIVFIKNIDNILPDRLKGATLRWKKILAGYLLLLEARVSAYLDELGRPGAIDRDLVDGSTTFLRRELLVEPPSDLSDAESRRRYLIDRFDRPLRVCGVVPNQGEPGGGPFWVQSAEGEITLQIVEGAEVDEAQRGVFNSSTHFSPVDLVCLLRNREGQPFDLDRFINPEAVFITDKSHQGRKLRALERPGLWNGAMARWNTVFVEVPAETFAPVKTIFDLLRPEHQ
jgi:hypothetical protein